MYSSILSYYYFSDFVSIESNLILRFCFIGYSSLINSIASNSRNCELIKHTFSGFVCTVVTALREEKTTLSTWTAETLTNLVWLDSDWNERYSRDVFTCYDNLPVAQLLTVTTRLLVSSRLGHQLANMMRCDGPNRTAREDEDEDDQHKR